MLTPIAPVALTAAAPVLHSTDARPAAAAQLGRKVRVANSSYTILHMGRGCKEISSRGLYRINILFHKLPYRLFGSLWNNIRTIGT